MSTVRRKGSKLNKRKLAAWKKVTDAVIPVGSEEKTLSEVKRKWLRLNLTP